MMALFILSTVFFLIVSGLTMLQLSRSVIADQLTYHGQAVNAAQAGLVDSLSWFRRQTTQPVAQFVPAQDLSATPPVNDTDDPAIGLVRDYEISDLGGVWGRYEVRTDRVDDVTDQRGKQGTGTVWSVDSVGVIYVRNDLNRAHDAYPNRVLAEVTTRSEIQRISLVLPGNAAVCAQRGDGVSSETATRILGGSGMGVLYSASSGTPSLSGGVSGIVSTGTTDPYLNDINSVFGVAQQELVGMADVVASTVDDLPAILPQMSLTVVRGDATFTSAHPLIGTGILVVLGDLVMSGGSLSNFNGLVYTTGDYEQNSPSQVSGAVVAQGAVRIRGSGDFSEINFDGPLLGQIQRHLSQYRFSRTAILVKE